MILTLGLVERDVIQKALSDYQNEGGATGFPRWLFEQGILARDDVQRVAQELERWFLAERRRAMGFEDPKDVKEPSDETSATVPATQQHGASSSSIELAVPPDEESARKAPTSQGTSRPQIVLQPRMLGGPPPSAPASQPQRHKTPPLAQPRMPGGAAPRPPATPAASAPRPSGRIAKPAPAPPIERTTPPLPAPRLTGPRKTDMARPAASFDAPPAKKPSGTQPALPTGSGAAPPKKTSARIKVPDEPATPPPAPKKTGSVRVPAVPPEAPAPAKRTGSVRIPAELAKEEGAPKDKQWALFEKATKDPLTRLVGARLGRTEVLKLLSTTDIITTFEGRHGDDERAAVVKVLRPDRVKDKVALERFTREAQVLEKIDHPNIAKILETGTAEGVRYISMEVGTGEALSTMLERTGKLPVDRVARIGRGVALGLAAAHRAGVIHRDLRPANILVEGGAVKIVGFGVARDVAVPGRLTATGHITGHPSYIAPEAAANAEVTPKTDVYSLGIVMFLAISGRLPFESRSVVKLVGLHLNAKPPRLEELAPDCPPKLAQLVAKLLAKDPDKRPEAMDVGNALAAKDILDAPSSEQRASAGADKLDPEELLRRALAPDEHPSFDEGAERMLGGPACAACELPLGEGSHSLQGNEVCARCFERVEALELCAACLLEVGPDESQGQDVAVFSGHIYCRACTRRVRLPCGVCGRDAPISGLANGQTKARGDQLVHATCSR
jgi:hypothetical protein